MRLFVLWALGKVWDSLESLAYVSAAGFIPKNEDKSKSPGTQVMTRLC